MEFINLMVDEENIIKIDKERPKRLSHGGKKFNFT